MWSLRGSSGRWSRCVTFVDWPTWKERTNEVACGMRFSGARAWATLRPGPERISPTPMNQVVPLQSRQLSTDSIIREVERLHQLFYRLARREACLPGVVALMAHL